MLVFLSFMNWSFTFRATTLYRQVMDRRQWQFWNLYSPQIKWNALLITFKWFTSEQMNRASWILSDMSPDLPLFRIFLIFSQSVKRWCVYCMYIVLFEAPSPRSKPRHEASSRSSHSSSSPPQYNLHSFSLLNYDKERLERKVNVCVFACEGRKGTILWSNLSDSLQNTERVDRIHHLTSYGSRKRWRTDCSGRRPSWKEHLQPCSAVTPSIQIRRKSQFGQCDRN